MLKFSFVLVLATILSGAGWLSAQTPAVTYDYPPQPSLDLMNETDANRELLIDSDDRSASWGTWDCKTFVVDWSFASPVRVRSIQVTIHHPVNPDTDGTHPRLVQLFVAGENGEFDDEPSMTLPIPFQKGAVQKITLAVPGDGLCARKLRTRFEGTNRQIVIGEVAFETQTISDYELAAWLKVAADARPEPLKPVTFLPAGPIDRPAPPRSSIFGAAGHMLHTDHFYPGHFSQYWRMEYTLPFMQQLGIASVREPIYQDYFKEELAENRKLVDQYMAAYDRAGINVVICAIVANSGGEGKPGEPGLESYCRWIADMAKRYRCIEAVEIGNEPNLTPFWKHSYQDYIESAREVAALLKREKPDLPIIVGSFSGMGGVWMRPDMLAEAGSDEKDQAIYWAKKCFEAGLLEFADGVSTHPYCESDTQPEGGIFLQSRKDPNGYEKELADFWALVQKYNVAKRPLKLYFTELGYEITSTRDAQWQADYLSRHMLILLAARVNGGLPIERVHWYDFKEDDEIVGASGWGLVARNTSHVRPAYVVYQQIARNFGDPDDLSPIDVTPEFNNWAESIKHYAWQRKSDKAIVFAFWRMDQLQKKDVDFDAELLLQLPESFKVSRMEAMDLHANQALPVGFRQDGQALKTAVHVTRRAAWLVIHGD